MPERVRLRIDRDKDSAERIYEASCCKITLEKMPCKLTIIKDQTDTEELLKERLSLQYQRILIASVTHEIRTPLNIELGMLETICQLRDWDKISPYVEIAKKNMQLLAYLVKDVPDLCRCGGGKEEAAILNKSDVNIRKVVAECEELTRFQLRSKDLGLTVRVDDVVPAHVVTDETRYRRVLLNLLLNAIKYTEKGSITIMVEWQPPNLTYTSVSDTGAGIKPEMQARLFYFAPTLDPNQNFADMFVNPQGIGLGLTMCKKLAVSMGGDIEVRSTFGAGSRFTFWVQDQSSTPASQKTGTGPLKAAEITAGEEKDATRLNIFQDTTDIMLEMDVPAEMEMEARNRLRESPMRAPDATTAGHMMPKIRPRAEPVGCRCAEALMVDDEPMNQLVIRSYLKSVGKDGDPVSLF